MTDLLQKITDLRAKLTDTSKSLEDRAKTDISFFDWNISFSDVFAKGGFDIVIGNPPYVQLQGDGGKYAKLYESCGYETFARTGDMYCLFYERGWQNLNIGGHLCYITSNKWMRAGYGELTREFFSAQTNPKLLIDFSGTKVFESATVDTNILLFEKGHNRNQTKCCVTKKLDKNGVSNLSLFVQQNSSTNSFTGSDSWVILSPIEQSIKQKIEAIGTPLKDWDIQINYGIKTGFNDAFIISTEKRNELLTACKTTDERKRTEELIRPILRGRDIKRYSYDWANLWIIATFPSRHYNINDYPSVKNFLLSFGIERLEQTGTTHIINGQKVQSRKKTNNKWFEVQDSISYWEDFDKPKIMYPNMTMFMPFYYDELHFIQNDKSFMITGKHISYLTAIFNSSLFKFCFRDNFPVLGENGRELRKIFFDKIPILEVNDAIDEEFHILVNDIQQQYTEDKANFINERIFDLYHLTMEERTLVLNA